MIDIVKERAKLLNVLIKDVDKLEVQRVVTYLGVNFDHNRKLIGISNKTLQKLPIFTQHMQAGDVYRGVARLIYCSGPLNINIGHYYFAIKQAVRVTHAINKRHYEETQMLSLPAGRINSATATTSTGKRRQKGRPRRSTATRACTDTAAY
jgi:hypothetical protein